MELSQTARRTLLCNLTGHAHLVDAILSYLILKLIYPVFSTVLMCRLANYLCVRAQLAGNSESGVNVYRLRPKCECPSLKAVTLLQS